MKKGFTLIELLAVIVILAIIAVIAVPIVLNIIDESKKNATLRSADFYLDAVEFAISDAYLNDGGLQDGEYPITPEGNLCKTALPCSEENTLKVEVNGEVPKSGTITITGGSIFEIELKYEEKTIVKNGDGDLVYFEKSKLSSVCKPSKEQPYTTNPLEVGYKYECKVDPNKDPYTFYVLSYNDENKNVIKNKTNAKSVNLIMDQNINSDGTPAGSNSVRYTENASKYNALEWISNTDYYFDVGGTIPNDILNTDECEKYDSCGFSDKGPITALKFLEGATKNWTNTNEIIINNIFNENGALIEIETHTLQARLPLYFNDIQKTEVSNKTDDSLYLYDNLVSSEIYGAYGYWTMTASTDNHFAFSVHGIYKNVSAWYVGGIYLGIRPVINLKI